MPKEDPLTQLSEDVYALTGPVNSAIVAGADSEGVILDSGQDADHGRRIKRALERLGIRPVALLNTHSHADHYGGNDYLTRQFPDMVVYAPPFEAQIMRAPYLEPVYLFSGAKPPAEMLSKWLMAKPSPVHHEVLEGPLQVAGVGFELLDTSGHAHRMFSVKVGDVLFASDAVFGPATLERYPLPFAQDVGAQSHAHEVVDGSGAKVVLPGHGDATEDVSGLVGINRAAVARAAEAVRAACTDASTEEVLHTVGRSLELSMDDLARYHLNLCTVSAYLTYLRESGSVDLTVSGGRLTWGMR